MVGDKFWSTGVILKWNQYSNQWAATIKFFDSGFCQDGSTEGEIHTRYYCDDINDAIRVVMEDAKKLGIVFNVPTDAVPRLYLCW